MGVHPELGDLGDFAAFIDEANDRGIRVIIDLVVNHTSDLSRAVFLFGENDEAAVENKDLPITLEGYGYDWIRVKPKGS